MCTVLDSYFSKAIDLFLTRTLYVLCLSHYVHNALIKMFISY